MQVFRSIKYSRLHEQSRQAEIERIEQEMLAARSSRRAGEQGSPRAARAAAGRGSGGRRRGSVLAAAAALQSGVASVRGLLRSRRASVVQRQQRGEVGDASESAPGHGVRLAPPGGQQSDVENPPGTADR